MPPIAKAKKKRRDLEDAQRLSAAIEGFQNWKAKNPNATTQECFDTFDRYIDSIELHKVVNAS